MLFIYFVKYVKGRKIKVARALNDVTKVYEGTVVNNQVFLTLKSDKSEWPVARPGKQLPPVAGKDECA